MNTSNIKGKVEFCIKTWEKCRNDDEYLYAAVCSQFYGNFLHRDCTGDLGVKLRYFSELPSMATVIRVRQKFQSHGLYLANDNVALERERKQVTIHQEMIKHISNVNL